MRDGRGTPDVDTIIHLHQFHPVVFFQTNCVQEGLGLSLIHIYPAEPPPRPVCTRSPLCVGCPYPANGFLCWGRDGKCLRSEMRRLNAPDRQVAQEVKEE